MAEATPRSATGSRMTWMLSADGGISACFAAHSHPRPRSADDDLNGARRRFRASWTRIRNRRRGTCGLPKARKCRARGHADSGIAPPSRMTRAQRSRIAANTPVPWPYFCDIAGHSNPRKGTATIKRTPRPRRHQLECDGTAPPERDSATKLRCDAGAPPRYRRTWDNGISLYCFPSGSS